MDGYVPLTAESDKRIRAWGVAIVIGLLAVAISFGRHVDAFGMTFSGLLGKAQQKYDWSIDRAISDRQLVAGNASVDSAMTTVAHGANSLPWEPYRPELLDELIKKNNTVLVDFTADW
jgi:thiol:disulfide interchange protein